MENIKRLEEELASKTEIKNQTVRIARKLRQRTGDHDKEIMETRLTAGANTNEEGESTKLKTKRSKGKTTLIIRRTTNNVLSRL